MKNIKKLKNYFMKTYIPILFFFIPLFFLHKKKDGFQSRYCNDIKFE
jgi:hypothetical protein